MEKMIEYVIKVADADADERRLYRLSFVIIHLSRQNMFTFPLLTSIV